MPSEAPLHVSNVALVDPKDGCVLEVNDTYRDKSHHPARVLVQS